MIGDKIKEKDGETMEAYEARIAAMQPTSSGEITDYLARGDRPRLDEAAAEQHEGGKILVRPNVTAPSIAAKYDRGLLFKAPWESYADGFAEHSRRLARALSLAGVPVHLRSILPRYRNAIGEDRLVDKDYADLLHASVREYSGQVLMAVPSPGLLRRLVTSRYYNPEELKYIQSRIVLSTVWERTAGVAADDVAAINACGQAWVGCRMSKDLLVGAGVDADKIRIVPCPFLPDDPHLDLFGRKRRSGVPRFYHVGKWEPRKEQRRIFKAFMLAFKPGAAMLLFKTSETSPTYKDYPSTPEAALGECLSDPRVVNNGWTEDNVERDIVIMARRLTGQQMIDLHRVGDIYVSLSRGEGFDMPAFDAKLSGNLMVYTPSGGPQSFCGGEDECVEATGSVPCHAFYRWPEGSEYIDYDIIDAARALQRAAQKLDTLDAQRRRGTSLSMFAAESVGARVRGYLEQLGVLFS